MQVILYFDFYGNLITSIEHYYINFLIHIIREITESQNHRNVLHNFKKTVHVYKGNIKIKTDY